MNCPESVGSLSRVDEAIEWQARSIEEHVRNGKDSSLVVETLCMLRKTRQLLVEDRALRDRLLELDRKRGSR
jgi:hypothetical protein